MKVGVCRKCRYFREHHWSTYYEPRNYHAIGIPHVYGYCALMKKRCLDVKITDCIPNQVTLFEGEIKQDDVQVD